MTRDAILSLKGVAKSYRNSSHWREVLSDFSVDLHRGESIAILGPNASGKSTLLRLALGLLAPDVGAVITPPANCVSYVPQDYRNALFPWLTIRKNAALYTNGLRGKTTSNHTSRLLAPVARAFSVLATVTDPVREQLFSLADTIGLKLSFDRYPQEFSGGEQQMIVLFLAMTRSPALLVADEPFSAIDVDKKERLSILVNKWLHETQTSFLFVSHDLDEAVFFADRIIVLANGDPRARSTVTIPKAHPRDYRWRYSEEFVALRASVKEAFST